MYYLKFGSKGDEVRDLQIALNIEADGIFGRMTEAAVKNYQRKNEMYPDGVATPELLETLLDMQYTTDVSERHHGEQKINQYYLPTDQYNKENITTKEYIFLHHTAGSHNPYLTVDGWQKDDRGKIATQYVIGGVGLNREKEYDGVIVECFPDDGWAYHLGRVDNYMHSHSVGIEICNWGHLTEENGKFFTYTGREVMKEQVHKQPKPFKGFTYYHRYSSKQLESLKFLINFLSKKYEIPTNKGLAEWIDFYDPQDAFSYYVDAMRGKVKGILAHGNVRMDKDDVYPDSRLIKILKDINKDS